MTVATYQMTNESLNCRRMHPLNLPVTPQQALMDQLADDSSDATTSVQQANIALVQHWLANVKVIAPLKKLDLDDNLTLIVQAIHQIRQHLKERTATLFKDSAIIAPLLKRLVLQRYLYSKQRTTPAFDLSCYQADTFKKLRILQTQASIDITSGIATLDYLTDLEVAGSEIAQQFAHTKNNLIARLGYVNN